MNIKNREHVLFFKKSFNLIATLSSDDSEMLRIGEGCQKALSSSLQSDIRALYFYVWAHAEYARGDLLLALDLSRHATIQPLSDKNAMITF